MLFLSHKNNELEKLISPIQEFLQNQLKLTLPPDKIILRPLDQGIDFLGYVTLPYHRVLRTTTRKRMLRKLSTRHSEFDKGEFYKEEVTGDSLNQSLN